MSRDFKDNRVLTDEEMCENFEKFEQLCQRLGDRADAVSVMLDEMAERLAVAPASSRRDFHAAYPGGLIDHSLRVAQYALTLRKSLPLFEDLPAESVIFSALFHDIGKVGEPGKDGDDYYVVETSEWHREKLGQYYRVNPDKQYVKNVDHSTMLLLHYGIKPTQDEFLAIRLNDGPADEMNKGYTMREPKLALLVHVADRLACEEEKENTQ